MYWSDIAKAVIMQSRLDGSEVRAIVNTGLIAPGNAGLTIRMLQIAGNNYWIIESDNII